MEETNSKQPSSSEENTEEKSPGKEAVGQLFGIELSAPKGMKNPLSIFILLVVGNFLLLFFLAKALGLF